MFLILYALKKELLSRSEMNLLRSTYFLCYDDVVFLYFSNSAQNNTPIYFNYDSYLDESNHWQYIAVEKDMPIITSIYLAHFYF